MYLKIMFLKRYDTVLVIFLRSHQSQLLLRLVRLLIAGFCLDSVRFPEAR